MIHLLRKGLAAAAVIALPIAAQAADLAPTYKAAPIVVPFSWTGFYVGVHAGGGWGTKEWDQTIGVPGVAINGIAATPAFPITSVSSHGVNGFLGGGQIGFNLQSGWTVWGAEADISAANLKGRGNCGFIALWNCSTTVDSVATLAARFGATFDHTMVYVKGGGAWARDTLNINLLGISAPGAIQPFSATDNRWGWMVGTGVEVALDNSWSAKVEYDYMDLGTKSYVLPTVLAGGSATPAAFNNWDITQRIHLVKFGLNYRFGGGFAAAR